MGGVALLVIGNSPATLLPFIVGTLEDGFNLNKQTTGSVVSTELIAMSLSAIFFGSLVNKINISISSIVGSFAVISGYFICAFINEIEILRLVRAVSGVGSGLLIATGHRVLSASDNPERSYAAFTFLVSITGACFLFLAGIVAEEGGYSSLFKTFGFTFLIIFPLTLFAKTKLDSDINQQPGKSNPSKNKLFLIIILGVIFFAIPSGGMWAFVERLGVEIGISQYEIGKVIAYSLLVGVLAPVLVWFLGDRFGRKRPIIICLIIIIISLIYILKSMNFSSYLVGNITWNFAYMVTVIFVLAAAARLSPDGKLASWLNASTLLSQASAPIFFGLILTNLSFPNLLPYLLVSICLSLFCIFLTKNQLDK
ncbi:MAG: MFS transporter [SAR86 cluster bacterium]|jgi:MFS family permease